MFRKILFISLLAMGSIACASNSGAENTISESVVSVLPETPQQAVIKEEATTAALSDTKSVVRIDGLTPAVSMLLFASVTTAIASTYYVQNNRTAGIVLGSISTVFLFWSLKNWIEAMSKLEPRFRNHDEPIVAIMKYFWKHAKRLKNKFRENYE